MGLARTRTMRDAGLVLVGALCMHIATSFFSTFQPETFTGDIIFNTEVRHDVHKSNVAPPAHREATVQSPSQLVVAPAGAAADVAHDFPETTIEAHAPGWTVLKNLYMSNGTLFIVSSHPYTDFPDIKFMTSTGLPAENTPENIAARMPTAKDLDFITPSQARMKWGPVASQRAGGRNRVYSVQGNTFLFNDPSQFLDHYYHFCAELWLGAWAFWQGTHKAEVDAKNADEFVSPPITRAIFPHADVNGWRDRPGFNSYFLRGAFPSITVEVSEDWRDRVVASSALGEHARAWHFDKVLLADRSAAFRGIVCGTQVQRTAGEAFHHMRNIKQLSKWWWEPVRRAILRFADIDQKVIEIGTRAYAQAEKTGDSEVSMTGSKRFGEKVVVTYINRQGVRRHLVEEDHDRLVRDLEDMAHRNHWELNVVQAEKLTKEEQLELVAKTTVLLGVHGNGLTHLIMMPTTPISTVIEMFYPGGFAHDYEWTARALGHKHFAIWNDTYHTHPKLPWVDYPEGFQGTQIPVYAPTVVQIIEDRVAGRLP